MEDLWKPLLDNTTLAAVLQRLNDITPSQWCQAYYLFTAGAVVAVAAMPNEVSRRLVDYGARKVQSEVSRSGSRSEGEEENDTGRGTGSEAEVKAKANRVERGGKNWLLSLTDTLTSYGQVPHSWFITFYVASMACSLLWFWQFAVDGRVLRVVTCSQASPTAKGEDERGGVSASSVTLGQVGLAWTMMFLQGSRRLYEDSLVHGKSKSTMWIVHWVLGLSYYLFTSVAVWVEGSGAIDYTMPSFKALVGTFMFLYASVNQYRCHRHLAGLKKYSLPDLGLFRYLICPHYFCECLVYLSLAVVAAPQGELLNKTLLCALVFVVVNLGVTAAGTRKWTQLAPQLGDFQNIAIREADPDSPLVFPVLVQRRLAEKTPVCNGPLRHVHVGRKRVNAMKNPPHGLRIEGPVFFGPVEVEAQTRSKAHCANHGVVCRSVLVRHNARVGRVFVNKDVVRPAVGAIREDVLLLLFLFLIATAIG
ncbi:uncharacterized protein B0T23DRAFT_403781 [Neurospora hispaniola]|uniref:Polyprenal reductase n=1 Tax=Neurospora hispaniola TaxID=588809 RepID=A0AAJ0IAF9_9PEZI|nr:hypothetical protein B0T23DRAFT_403781 [Neurospora hispaniola]